MSQPDKRTSESHAGNPPVRGHSFPPESVIPRYPGQEPAVEVDGAASHRLTLSIIALVATLFLAMVSGYWPIVLLGGFAFSVVAILFKRPVALYIAIIIWLMGAVLPSASVNGRFQSPGGNGWRVLFVNSKEFQRTRIEFIDLLQAGTLILYSTSMLRYLELAQREDFHAAVLKTMHGAKSQREEVVRNYRLSPFRGIAFSVLAATMFAATILFIFSHESVQFSILEMGLARRVRFGAGLATGEARALIVTWIYIGSGLIMTSLLGFVKFRQSSKRQAQVYLVDQFEKEIGNEVGMIERARLKNRLKKLKRG